MAVRLLGTDRIGHYEEVVKDAFWNLVRLVIPEAGTLSAEKRAQEETAEATLREGGIDLDPSLDADEIAAVRARNGGDACKCILEHIPLTGSWLSLAIWTQLGLAYLVHKSLIFFRVPLTAAVLPKVVKTLRKWGYNIGKKKPKTDWAAHQSLGWWIETPDQSLPSIPSRVWSAFDSSCIMTL
jgi:hypothetical protein